MKCPMCHCEVLGRPTQCSDCGYRFTRSDFEKIKEQPVEDQQVASGDVFCTLNGVLGVLNIVLLFFPIVSNYGMSYNLFGLLGEVSKYGGSYVSAGLTLYYVFLVIMAILDIIFVTTSFSKVRASGGIGIASSIVTFWVLHSLRSNLSSSVITFAGHAIVIIPFITLVFSIVVLVLQKNK